jgi:hypothetical protein
VIKDPIVEEIRETRARILEECGGDLDKLLDRIQKSEEKDRHRLVTMEDVERMREQEHEHVN